MSGNLIRTPQDPLGCEPAVQRGTDDPARLADAVARDEQVLIVWCISNWIQPDGPYA